MLQKKKGHKDMMDMSFRELKKKNIKEEKRMHEKKLKNFVKEKKKKEKKGT